MGGLLNPGDQAAYLVFEIAGESFAVDVLRVREVSTLGPVTRVPGAVVPLRGLVNLHGSVIPVLDVRVRLGSRPTCQSPRRVLVEANALVEGAATVIGLMVDEVEGILGFSPEAILAPPPGLSAREPDLVTGLADVAGRLVILLDIDVLVEPSRLRVAQPARASTKESVVAPTSEVQKLEPPRPDGAFPTAVGARAGTRPNRTVPIPERRVGALPRSPPPVPPVPRRTKRRLPPEPVGASRSALVSPRLLPSPVVGWRRPVRADGTSTDRDAKDGTQAVHPRERCQRGIWIVGFVAAGAAALLLVTVIDAERQRGEPQRSKTHTVSVTSAADARPALPTAAHPANVYQDQSDVPASGGPAKPRESSKDGVTPPPFAWNAPIPAYGDSPSQPDSSSARRTHEVRPGDSLWSLSNRFFGQPDLWRTIFAANRNRIEDPNVIFPGQRLDIPPSRR